MERVVTLVDAPAFCEQWMSYDVMEDRIKNEDEDPYHPTSMKRLWPPKLIWRPTRVRRGRRSRLCWLRRSNALM